LEHSQAEKQYYCFGLNEQGNGILTVRFTYRSGCIRIFGAKVKKFMNKIIQYSNEPIGDLNLIPDFLPSPEELAPNNKILKLQSLLVQRVLPTLKTRQKNITCSIKK